ncbi:MAG: VWA domain-containing protein, partial [Chthoniobacterales bacterium]
DYADVPVVRDEGTANFSGDLQQTRTRLALQYSLSLMAPDRAARVLALTDGFSTEPLDGVAERLAQQKTSLDYRLVRSPDVSDYEITALRMPSRAQPGEPFLVEVEVAGNPDGTVQLQVTRDGKPISKLPVEVRGGHGRTRFTDRVVTGGAHNYGARLAVKDARSGNDAASQWIEVLGGPRILLVTGYTGDPVAAALRAQGFEVEVITGTTALDIGRLSGAKAVILNNVPAYRLPPDFLAAIDLFVRVQGGGLLMAGGKFSFGSGGYFGSAIADLLPVSMELRAEQRKLAVAMAIVMDRSGSMGAGVAPGVIKMDLANEGAARAIGLLGISDAVSVLAVDSEPHAVVPLTELGANRDKITDTVRRITSGGGGIYVYQGLKAGWEELKKATAGQRHLILFADAADSEEPGDYKKLLEEMTAAGATVSVIGLGTESDSDADFLKNVAARGGGRIFFNADANTLPALFEQETVAVARSAFIDKPVGLQSTSGWLEIAAKLPDWPAEVDGYNLSYLKPDATAGALAKDEYAAPLVAFWQRGAGRTAAVSFPLGGDFSERIRKWSGYGDFLQTLVRWSGGEALPPGIGLRTR